MLDSLRKQAHSKASIFYGADEYLEACHVPTLNLMNQLPTSLRVLREFGDQPSEVQRLNFRVSGRRVLRLVGCNSALTYSLDCSALCWRSTFGLTNHYIDESR